jgi:MFS family permease
VEVILVVGTGAELWVRFLPAYLEALGGGVWVVAAHGAIFSLLDAVCQYPGGWAADRLGRRRSLILFTLAAAAGYALYLGTHWRWVLAGTFLVMAWKTLALPSLFAAVGDNLPPEKRAAGFDWQSAVRRIPTMVAPLLGGRLIAGLGVAAGVRVGLAVTTGCCLLAVLVLTFFYREGPSRPHEPVRMGGVWRAFDARLRRLLVADILARWAEGIPRVFVVIHCTQNLGLSALFFGWLMTVQRATNLVADLPAIGLGGRLNRKPFVLATFAFFALFPLLTANVTTFPGLVITFVVAGLWEPARKAQILDLAPEAVRGRAVALYYLLRNPTVVPAALMAACCGGRPDPRQCSTPRSRPGWPGSPFTPFGGPAIYRQNVGTGRREPVDPRFAGAPGSGGPSAEPSGRPDQRQAEPDQCQSRGFGGRDRTGRPAGVGRRDGRGDVNGRGECAGVVAPTAPTGRRTRVDRARVDRRRGGCVHRPETEHPPPADRQCHLSATL